MLRTRETSSAAILEQLMTDLESFAQPGQNNMAEKIIRIRLKSDALDAHVSSFPSSLRETKASLSWIRYSKEKNHLHPADHSGKICGMLYQLESFNGTGEDKACMDKFKIMLMDFKAEFDEEFVRELMNMNKAETPTYTPVIKKSDNELLKEHIERLEIERRQAIKDKHPDEAARINTLIKQCEARLFHKPIKHPEIESQRQITTKFYFDAVRGGNSFG